MAQSQHPCVVVTQETKEKDIVQIFINILKSNQQSDCKFPKTVTSNNPGILKKPFMTACRAIYGDVEDERHNTLFIRDIFLELQDPGDDENNEKQCLGDVSAVMNSIRGKKDPRF